MAVLPAAFLLALPCLRCETASGGMPPRDVYVLLLVIDGAPGRVIDQMLEQGRLPNVQRYLVERGCWVKTALTVFPSVTVSAQVGAITGCLPGHSSVPSIKWYDRYKGEMRHYLSADFWKLDDDLALYSPKLMSFDRLLSKPETPFTRLAGCSTASVQQVVGRDAERRDFFLMALGASKILPILPHHTDRVVADRLQAAYRDPGRQPRFVFCCFPDFDCEAHSSGIEAEQPLKMLEDFDGHLGRIVQAMKDGGVWEKTTIILTADHGNTPVGEKNVANFGPLLSSLGLNPRERNEKDFDSVVAGNSLNSVAIYLADPEKGWKTRPAYETLRNFPVPKTSGKVDILQRLSEHEGTAFLAVQVRPDEVRVIDTTSELAITRRIFLGEYYYRAEIKRGPLDAWRYVEHPKLGEMIRSGEVFSGDEWLMASLDTQYPDAIVQITQIFDSFRSGDIAISMKPGWKVKPSSYRATHGSLVATDLVIPLLIAGPDVKTGEIPAARVTDIYPTILRLFGLEVPFNLMDGRPLDTILPEHLTRQQDPFEPERLAMLPAMKQLWKMNQAAATGERVLPHLHKPASIDTKNGQHRRLAQFLKRIKQRLASRLGEESLDRGPMRERHLLLRESLQAQEDELTQMIAWLDDLGQNESRRDDPSDETETKAAMP